VALERGTREEWVTEEWTAFERVLNGRSAARQRGKKRGGGGVRPWECHVARGRSWGLAGNREGVN
jgi:hypothetical protein